MSNKRASKRHLIEPSTWPWPFSRPDLTAGLRRYLADTSLQVENVRPLTMADRLPSIGRIHGLLIQYQTREGAGEARLVLKEPQGTTRTGLAGAGRREAGFYRVLAQQVPMSTPDLIGANPQGDWLLLEFLETARRPARWTAADYLRAVEELADLHNRFWALGEDLEAFPWLSDPLLSDFSVHQAAADEAIERIAAAAKPEPMAGFPGRRWLLERLAREASRIIQPLRDEPGTLLHGDYWPGNITIRQDERHSVYDWQLAGIGPGILDLLVFVNKSDWWYGPLPVERHALIEHYRLRMETDGGIIWTDERWSELWDHALMWRFVQEWLDLLAVIPLPVLATRAEQLDAVWLQPVEDALSRRLGG
jgi:hypothetical protein